MNQPARHRLTAGLVALLAAATVTGCASTVVGPGAAAGVAVVATTNVWGDVAEQVGGDRVRVTSLIDDPAADPHSFQAGARDELSLRKAALIIENGGGYDDFVDPMIKAAGGSAVVVNAVAVSGKHPVDGELNEHVWYDFPTVVAVADRIAEALSTADPAHANEFRARAATFNSRLTVLIQREVTIRGRDGGAGVVVTEPVPLYLLQACGLVDRTPPAFSAAIESETDVSAAVLAQTLALLRDHRVAALVYNEQTTGPQTVQLRAAALAAGIPVVGVTEILPAGQDYLSWMSSNLDRVSAAVAR